MTKITAGSSRISSYEADDDAKAYNKTKGKFTLVQAYSWAIYCKLRWMKHQPGRHYHITVKIPIALDDDAETFYEEVSRGHGAVTLVQAYSWAVAVTLQLDHDMISDVEDWLEQNHNRVLKL